MHAQLRETATELAAVLWREHTVYRDRAGGVVIRGEHVRRWISIAPRGGRDEVLIRAGRILDGGTTAPARSEVVVSLAVGRDQLATICRRLLAEAAAGPEPSTAAAAAPDRARPAPRKGRKEARRRTRERRTPERRARERRSRRHTSLASWLVLLCVLGAIVLYVYLVTVP